MRNALLNAAKSLLAAVEDMYPTSNLYFDFSKKETRRKLNRLFTSDGVQAVLEEKDYCCLDMVFRSSLHC